MSRPNAFTSDAVPFAAATDPAAESAALAPSRMATMLASVSAGAAGVMAGAAVAATAEESAARALSEVFSPFEQAATSAAAQVRANGVRRSTLSIGPPNGVGRNNSDRTSRRSARSIHVKCTDTAELARHGAMRALHPRVALPDRSLQPGVG